MQSKSSVKSFVIILNDKLFFYSLYGSGVEVKSGANGYPFVTLAWVGTGLGTAQVDVDYFEYKVCMQ